MRIRGLKRRAAYAKPARVGWKIKEEKDQIKPSPLSPIPSPL